MAKEELSNNQQNKFTSCDKYDYFTAITCGVIGGMIDIFFVGAPGQSTLGAWTDKQVDKTIVLFSKSLGWKPSNGCKNEVKSAISFLEKNYKVNYDHRHSKDVNDAFKMTTKNHHMKSLAHAPDIVGLFFSILDQFTSNATFLDSGKLFTVDTKDSNFELRGGNFVARVFCGFVNWFCHLMSDVAGSSGAVERGSGVVMPFFELFGLCNFGKFRVGKDRQDLATIATRAFQEGYDARHGITMTIPVIVTELLIRFIWSVRQRFQFGTELEKCFPTQKNENLRLMLICGNGTLCFVDGSEAIMVGAKDHNFLTFFCHLNLVGWIRFAVLILKDVQIRYNISLVNKVDPFFEKVFGKIPEKDRIKIVNFEQQFQKYTDCLNAYQMLKRSLEEYKLSAQERKRIEAECQKNIDILNNERQKICLIVENYLNSYLTAFNIGQNMIDEALEQSDSKKYIEGNLIVQKALDCETQFETKDEFDDLMESDDDFKL